VGHVNWIRTDELRNVEPPKVSWVIEDLVARGHVTLLVGAPGQGKSFLMAALATGVAGGGVPVAGFNTEPGEVVIIDAENGAAEIHRRVHTLGLFANTRFADVTGGFSVVKDREEIFDAVMPVTVRLLVLDSLRTLAPGIDENSSDEVTAMLTSVQQIAREADVGVCVLHHLNRAGEFRGSGAMTAVPEVVVRMYGDANDKYQRRTLTWEKFRLGARPERKWITIKDGRVAESWSPGQDD
jgi:RecA-family ATPase